MTPKLGPKSPVLAFSATFWAILLLGLGTIWYVRPAPEARAPLSGLAPGRTSEGATPRRARPNPSLTPDVATEPSVRPDTSAADEGGGTDAGPGIAVFVAIEPRVLRVGERSVITVTLVNRSDRSIDGVRIFSSGPWDAVAVEDVRPLGRYDYDLLGATFSAPISVAPNQAGQVEIVVTPTSVGELRFTFTPTPAPGQRLPRTINGRLIVDAVLDVAR